MAESGDAIPLPVQMGLEASVGLKIPLTNVAFISFFDVMRVHRWLFVRRSLGMAFGHMLLQLFLGFHRNAA